MGRHTAAQRGTNSAGRNSGARPKWSTAAPPAPGWYDDRHYGRRSIYLAGEGRLRARRPGDHRDLLHPNSRDRACRGVASLGGGLLQAAQLQRRPVRGPFTCMHRDGPLSSRTPRATPRYRAVDASPDGLDKLRESSALRVRAESRRRRSGGRAESAGGSAGRRSLQVLFYLHHLRRGRRCLAPLRANNQPRARPRHQNVQGGGGAARRPCVGQWWRWEFKASWTR